MLGVLLAAGHDLNHLLDHYSLSELELMSGCMIQHKFTQLRVVAHIVTGGKSGGSKQTAANMTDEERSKQVRMAVSMLGKFQSDLKSMGVGSAGVPPPKRPKKGAVAFRDRVVPKGVVAPNRAPTAADLSGLAPAESAPDFEIPAEFMAQLDQLNARKKD